MKENLLAIIERDYSNLIDFDIILKQKSKEVQEGREKILSDKEQDLDKISDVYTNIFVDLALFGRDLKTLFDKLHTEINLYRELGFSDLPKEIIKFHSESAMNFQKQIFFIKDGSLIEKEDGSLEAERKKFLESDFMKRINEIK